MLRRTEICSNASFAPALPPLLNAKCVPLGKRRGSGPPSKEHVLDGVINPRPSTPRHDEAAREADFLRTPAYAREVDLLMGGPINRLDLTPQSLQRVIKLGKAAKQARADRIVAKTRDWGAQRDGGLAGEEKGDTARSGGLDLGVDNARKLATELREKQEGRNLVKRRTKAGKKKLGELIRAEIVKREAKRLPKRLYDEVEAELGVRGLYEENRACRRTYRQ